MGIFLVLVLIVLFVLGILWFVFYMTYTWISKILQIKKAKKNQRRAEIEHKEKENYLNLKLNNGSIINCIECNGSGLNGTCPVCKGSGVNYAFINEYEEREECSTCNGSGIQRIKLDLGNKIVQCEKCNGEKNKSVEYISLYIQTYSDQVRKSRYFWARLTPKEKDYINESFYNSTFSGYGYYFVGKKDINQSRISIILINSQKVNLGLEFHINNDKINQNGNTSLSLNTNSIVSGSSSNINFMAKILNFFGFMTETEFKELQSLNVEYDASLKELDKAVKNSNNLTRFSNHGDS